MKKLKLVLIFTIITLLSVSPVFAEIKVVVKNEVLSLDSPPVLKNGRTLVPVAAIANSLGAEVQWDAATKTVTIIKDNSTITLQLDNNTATINGESSALDVPAQSINGRTMVPLGFIASAFGSKMQWESSTQTAYIDSDYTPSPLKETVSKPIAKQTTTPAPSNPIGTAYVSNKNTKKFHESSCSSVSNMKASNKVTLSSREEAIKNGYEPCKRCNP